MYGRYTKPMPHTNQNPNNLDQRFDLRMDEETRERLDHLAKSSGLSRSEIIRILIYNARVEDVKDAA